MTFVAYLLAFEDCKVCGFIDSHLKYKNCTHSHVTRFIIYLLLLFYLIILFMAFVAYLSSSEDCKVLWFIKVHSRLQNLNITISLGQ